MGKIVNLALLGTLLLANGYFTKAQMPQEIICASSSFQNECADMMRGNSEVRCVIVQDPIECAQRIQNGTADLGLFSAESILQLAVMDWSELAVTKELRHKTRINEPVDFESVVIVRGDHQGGLEGLRGKKFCHPGFFYDRTQKWSERFQKHFERTVINPNCDIDGRESTADVEASAMSRFFTQACRPGRWSQNDEEDRRLKEKYPSLCSLCGTEGCSYVTGSDGSSDEQHKYALHCLEDRGDVAYVSKQEAISFFNGVAKERIESFAYLCPNGSLANILDNNFPCTWLRQPWGVVLSKNEKAIGHTQAITRWAQDSFEIWRDALKRILTSEDRVVFSPPGVQTPRNYVRFYRDIPVSFNPCVKELNWCTTSRDERDKCNVLAAGGIATGALPTINCNEPRESVLDCLSDIRSEAADLMAIDSNFGYLARNVYNLTPALYAETESDKFASVAILVHKDVEYATLEDLRGKRVCMPEFGGIASIAFINTLKANNMVPNNECDYGKAMAEYFADSCIPGASDVLHDPQGTVSQSLCNLCRTSIVPPVAPIENADVLVEESPAGRSLGDGGEEVEGDAPAAEDPLTHEEIERRNLRGSCAASITNRYYGNRGALQCLDELGEMAVLEVQFLHDHARDLRLNPNNYRILCRNGTLADRVGFNVDEDCFLTTIVDSEVVVRKTNSSVSDIINTLLSLDRYFISDPHFKVYNIYGGITNLLFKDSTMGLESAESSVRGPKVENYIQLFKDVEACGSAGRIVINVVMTVCLLLGAILVTQN